MHTNIKYGGGVETKLSRGMTIHGYSIIFTTGLTVGKIYLLACLCTPTVFVI